MKYFLLLILLNCFTAFSQSTTIKGTITDELGMPLPNVNVSENGTKNGTTTDFDGNYSLQVAQGSTLNFSFVGYITQSIKVSNKKIINIQLQPDIQKLEEVVVIGYGSVKKQDLTGSVATVKMDKIKEAPVANFDQALAGRVAGVQVSASSGEPGSALKITIRGGNTINGDNSPLYVVDGFIIDNFNPGIVDPADIESMNILKDASATAIYGVRGANGVVIIETKRAKVGKTKISYQTRLDVKSITKTLEVLSPYEFIKLSSEIDEASTTARYLSIWDEETDQSVQVGTIEDYKNVEGRNWQDEAFRTAFSKSHKLNIASGTETTRFNGSLNAIEDEGSLNNSKYNRFNGRFTINHKINKKLSTTVDVIYSNSKQYGLNTQGSSSYSFLRSLITYNNVANKYVDYNGFDPLNDISDQYDLINIVVWHPIVSLNNEYRHYENDQFISNLKLNYKLFPNLNLESKVSINKQFRKSEGFNNSKTVYGRLVNKIDGINGYVDHQRWNNFSSVNTMNYKKRIDNHTFDALLGVTLNINKYDRTRISAKDIPQYAEGLGINSLDEGTLNDSNDINGSSETRVFSLLGRFNYSYNDRYLFTASLRRDASSIFPKNNRVGYFPSAAISWNAHKEPFIKNLNTFSQLKFKLGYGKTGNDRIPSTARFDFLTSDNASYIVNGNEEPGQRPTSFGSNPNLFWETTEQVNFGLDLGFFNNRLFLGIEAYQKDTKDLLINAETALSQGYSTVWENTGHVRNRGLEFSLNTKNIDTKNFQWTSDFNISFNLNTVESLPEGKPIFGRPNYYWRLSSNQFIVQEGKSLGNIYGYISDGVYQPEDFVNYDPNASTHTLHPLQPSYKSSHQPGDEKYKDITGDGKITGADKTIIGNALPKHYGGFNNTFTYKNLSLSTFFQWSYGNDILNANRLVLENMQNAGQNQLATTLNRWTPENQNTTMHRARGQGFEDVSSRVVEDGSFLRLKTVNLTYNFDKELIKKLSMDSLEFYLSAQNLFTWTKYSGYDPEVSVSNSAITPGIDYSAYPNHKVVSLGVNITF